MEYIDQLNRKINVSQKPRRIISLVPSQTELLYDLGLSEEVLGITKFCIYPNDWFVTKAKVGGTKKLDLDEINKLNPDLIIANKEENDKHQIEQLIKQYPVWISDIITLKNALDMITSLGVLLGKHQESMILKLQIESQFNSLKSQIHLNKNIKVACLIWKKPFMAVGGNTFINSMFEQCGFINLFSGAEWSRYPEISEHDLHQARPDIVLLLTEPYPFKESNIEDIKKICPTAKVIIADGEMFSWYGSRLLKAPEYYKHLIQTLM